MSPPLSPDDFPPRPDGLVLPRVGKKRSGNDELLVIFSASSVEFSASSVERILANTKQAVHGEASDAPTSQ